MRKCIGCMQSKPKSELVRIACYEGELSLDLTGRAKGRGVYLCRDAECIKKAMKKKAIQRSFSQGISLEKSEAILQELLEQEEDV